MTKYKYKIYDTGQTRNKLLAHWAHLTNNAAGHSRPERRGSVVRAGILLNGNIYNLMHAGLAQVWQGKETLSPLALKILAKYKYKQKIYL